MSHRVVEWQDSGPGYRVGVRQVLPEAEAAAAIASGRATGITPVGFLAPWGAYNRGETAGFPDHVAARLIELGWAEPVPVSPPAGDQGPEDKAIDQPPADRMLHNATVTKRVKP